ncbi:SEC14 cytosolic factor-like [Miscanthus floridulus]|uniref:SEC14 cytosolic factor-like n=1 Tax=Miscanthus floridulus TaxID=154761 RepID=UPI003459F46E
MAIDKVEAKETEKIEAVRKLLRKQAPLSAKQAQYCNDACVGRFLRSRGESVKKAAKHLRTVLSWRETVGADHIMADEFSAELADGVAFVSGHDDDGRPVVVFRIKQDYPKFHPQKSFVRLLVFTLEVAVACMSRFVDQFVLLFDASFFRSASAFLNLLMGTLKIVADYYPGRLHRAFVIDPPSLFSVLWKGVRPFVELAPATAVVCSLDFEDSLEDASFTAYPRTASLRYEPAAAAVVGKAGVGSASSRFSVTPTDNPIKPWYLSTIPTSVGSRSVVPTSSSPSLVGASPLSARSFSFASPATLRSTAATPPPFPRGAGAPLTPSSAAKGPNKTPPPMPVQQPQQFPRTPRPSFLQSPSMLFAFRKDGQASRVERERESFLPYLRFYRRPYDEISYRAKMRPPLGGLISIVGDKFKQKPVQQPLRRHAGLHHHYQQQQRI